MKTLKTKKKRERTIIKRKEQKIKKRANIKDETLMNDYKRS